jgi:hypothetical protein
MHLAVAVVDPAGVVEIHGLVDQRHGGEAESLLLLVGSLVGLGAHNLLHQVLRSCGCSLRGDSCGLSSMRHLRGGCGGRWEGARSCSEGLQRRTAWCSRESQGVHPEEQWPAWGVAPPRKLASCACRRGEARRRDFFSVLGGQRRGRERWAQCLHRVGMRRVDEKNNLLFVETLSKLRFFILP